MIPFAVTPGLLCLCLLACSSLSHTLCHSYPKLFCFLLQLLVATPARLIDILSNHGTPSLPHMFDTLHLSSSLHSCKLSWQSTNFSNVSNSRCTTTRLCTVTTPVTHHPVHCHHSCHPPPCSLSPLLSSTTLCTVTTPVTHHPVHCHHSCHPPP